MNSYAGDPLTALPLSDTVPASDITLIWDERATLHRGTPWPYEQARSLRSICINASVADGLDRVQPGAA